MNRRAFTLLELTVASFLGTAIIVASVGVFSAIARADRRTAARFDRSTQLAVLQRSVQRAWDSVIMGDGGATSALDPTSGEVEDPETPLPPLRILLEPDAALAPMVMSRRMALAQGWGDGETIIPQRLELALSAPPATQSARDYRRTLRLLEQGLAPVDIGPDVSADRSVRGAFEFRPAGRTTAFGEEVYSLWWRPMAQAETAEELAMMSRPDAALVDGAVELVEELIWARWRVFKGRQWHQTFRAITVPDLPAYAELEITTPEMMTANWIFEVAWTIGEDPSAAPEGEGGEGGEGGEEGQAGEAGAGQAAQRARGGATTETRSGTTTSIDGAAARPGARKDR